jgi:hypothetical protein
MYRISTRWLFILTALCGVNSPLVMADDDSPLFPADPRSASPLAVELQLPLTQLTRLKPDVTEAFDATLTLDDGTELALQVSPRGKSRRAQCSFPPLRLDFKKKAAAGTVFAGQNKLKLVTHCSSRLARGGYLAAEMLAYRFLNLFTDASFRVRALNVTYLNSDNSESETWPAFVIEHKKDLAKRMNGELLAVKSIDVSAVDPHYATVVNMFQLMVANTDFSILAGPGEECCHNAVPVQAEQVRVVQYDFDATGMVDAPYAHPSPAVNIRRVTQRLYRGYCAHNDAIPAVVEEFLAKQAEVFALVESFSDIPGLDRKGVSRYLSKFFEIIASPKSLDSKVVRRCR